MYEEYKVNRGTLYNVNSWYMEYKIKKVLWNRNVGKIEKRKNWTTISYSRGVTKAMVLSTSRLTRLEASPRASRGVWPPSLKLCHDFGVLFCCIFQLIPDEKGNT